MKKRILSMVLVLALVMSVLVMPAAASNTRSSIHGSVEVRLDGQSGKTYDCYLSQDEANGHTVVMTVTRSTGVFPIHVTFKDINGDTVERTTIHSYGTHRLRAYCSYFLASSHWIYTTIEVKYQAPTSSNATTTPKQPTKDELLQEKYETLMKEISFPFAYRDSSIYGKEVKAFVTGEWDGSRRSDNTCQAGGYYASRYVTNRTYYWIASNFINGKSYNISTNVDYNGYLECIPGTLSCQDYSLAVSRVNGTVEEWSLFEQRNSWKISLNGETVKTILPMSSDADPSLRAIVMTTDADGQMHCHNLYNGNKVEKLY